MTEALGTFGVGGFLGAGFSYLVDDRPAAALVVAFAALGAVLVGAVRQAIHGRS